MPSCDGDFDSKVPISRRWLLIGNQQKFSIHHPDKICVRIPHRWLQLEINSCDGDVDPVQTKSITYRTNTYSTHNKWWNLDCERIFSAHSSDRCPGGKYLMRYTVVSGRVASPANEKSIAIVVKCTYSIYKRWELGIDHIDYIFWESACHIQQRIEIDMWWTPWTLV